MTPHIYFYFLLVVIQSISLQVISCKKQVLIQVSLSKRVVCCKDTTRNLLYIQDKIWKKAWSQGVWYWKFKKPVFFFCLLMYLTHASSFLSFQIPNFSQQTGFLGLLYESILSLYDQKWPSTLIRVKAPTTDFLKCLCFLSQPGQALICMQITWRSCYNADPNSVGLHGSWDSKDNPQMLLVGRPHFE